MEEKLTDIKLVCDMLGTTSRTLRFYEEKGIVTSTKTGLSSRRQYSEKQIEHIKNVLVLRSLGISVNDISELQHQNGDLRNAIALNAKRIKSLIRENIAKLNMLNDALTLIDEGGDVYTDIEKADQFDNDEYKRIARICAEAYVAGDIEKLYDYFGEKVKEHMPEKTLRMVREGVLDGLGEFVGFDDQKVWTYAPNVVFQYIRYEKHGIRIEFDFNLGKITGFWIDYYAV